ncbi:ABC transporter ATP-binding protein [Bauldia sp.]|uniref:ABC transporter ATP-binding protein n=1 Tax=Bauldia sp. TaxID=2575872 RepID=UPI003BA96DD5
MSTLTPTRKPTEAGNNHKPLLVARGVHKFYNKVHAVRGVDFSLLPDRYVTLLGPSGCGKTTILRMIGGFETVSDGVIELDGADLENVPASRRPINTVFQSYALFPHLDVTENVAFGLSLRRLPKAEISAQVTAALRMVHMETMASRRPQELSGGQQQRVALARAIINQPRLLLLDEPLSALDRKMRKEMQIELKDLQRRLGMAFLHVTHDQGEAFALSDWIIVMNNGVIEQQGDPETIYRRPANAYVADFIGGSNLIAGTVTECANGVAVINTAFGRVRTACAPEVAVGRPASLCLRPEVLTLGGDEAIEGTVSHTVFEGSHWLVEATAGGSTLQLRLSDDAPPAVGSSIEVGYDRARAWIVDRTLPVGN